MSQARDQLGGTIDRITRRQALTGLAAMGVALFGARTTLGSSGPSVEGDLQAPGYATATFDVRTYGAVGNGSTDDAAAFDRAVSAAAAAGGGVVTVPSGTFIIGSSVKMRSYVTLRGQGSSSVLKLRNGANVHVIRSAAGTASNPVSNVGVENLYVDGNKANQSDNTEAYGIGMVAVNDSWVSGITVVNTVRSGIYLAGSRNTVSGCSVSGVGLSGSIIGRSGIVFDNDGVNFPVSCFAQNNSVSNVREHGIKVYTGGTGTVFESNTVSNNGDRGIYVMAASGVTVSNNVVSGSGTTGILIGGGGGQGSPNCVVSGNSVSGCVSHGILLWGSSGVTVHGNNTVKNNRQNGIYLVDSPKATISGNNISGNGANGGIVLYNASYSTISSNSALGNAGAGIIFWDDGSPSIDCKVSKNTCSDGGAGKQGYGVRSLNGTRNLTVTDNDLRGNLTSPLSLVGSGNVTTNNLTSGSPTSTTPEPTVTLDVALSPISGPVGTVVAVSGTGYGAKENVKVYIDTSTSTALASVTSTSAGSFSASIKIPAGATSGDHRIHAVGQTTKIRTAETFTVIASSTTQPETPTDTTAPVGDSLITNGSFEKGNAGWYIEPGAGVVNSNAHGGSYAMRIAKSGGFTSQSRAVKSGTTYTVTAWGKLAVSGDSGRVSVSYWDAAGARLQSAEPASL
ncbi:MAG: right-handed parallel beta-helix repeat-containing protein, partial [Thermomicrobiales bacterium]|nr:right-handed parallel beta-helix repeat-containing protein [Thermomicrobiales bacterium]